MIPNIIILRPAFERLNELNDEQKGEVFGIIYEGNLLVIGVNFDFSLDKQANAWHKIRRSIYPGGIDWSGLFHINVPQNSSDNEKIMEQLKEVVVTSNPVYIYRNEGNSEIQVSVLHNDSLMETKYEIMETEEFDKQFVYFNLRSMYSLYISDMSECCILESLDKLKRRIAVGECVFHVKDTEVFLNPETSGVIPPNATVEDFCSKNQSNVQNALIQGPFFVDVLFLSTISEIPREKSKFTIRHYIERVDRYSYRLPIDFLCVTRKNRLIQDCFGIFIDTMCRWCEVVRHYLISHFNIWVNFAFFRMCHFFPTKLAHYITYIYTSSATDDGLAEKRKYLHELFHLTPPTSPLFRWGNAVIFGKKDILLNVHRGLRYERVKDGRVTLVKGLYEYYHYMQKNFNDNGWGCAYRSLQTIFSWFKLQGYTLVEIPTHEDIQKCLVKIGDKPDSFIGSKSWIGSNEISYCLDEMLGISCSIINVSSGAELSTLGFQLQYHFNVYGSPIMIGGGSLAYTILGIDFEEDSGAIKFLILDPHYTGPDDKGQVHKKGGVLWRGAEFWQVKHFYNLCLPQVPIVF